MKNQATKCLLCPKTCQLNEFEIGDCKARQNINGRIILLTDDKPCSVALDPMEKKPLYHFYPGENILSLGLTGCNLHCMNCQNSAISQDYPQNVQQIDFGPQKLINTLQHYKLRHVAYTYTEPLVHYEYVKKCAQIVHKFNGTNTLITAGYINTKPLKELLPHIDAVNLDIKAIDDNFYRKNCDITLAPVLRNAKILRKANVHLEITNLLIPTLNDSDKHINDLVRFVCEELGNETVLHFSAFFPTYKRSNLYNTPIELLQKAANIAKIYGMKYVYIGNTGINTQTHCPNCQLLLIERARYRIEVYTMKNNTCPNCGTKIYGVYNDKRSDCL